MREKAPAIRKILLEDWDPHEANKRPEAHGTYDGWIPVLMALIESKPSEEGVMAWLHERESETMCFPSIGVERLRRVARKLLALNTSAED